MQRALFIVAVVVAVSFAPGAWSATSGHSIRAAVLSDDGAKLHFAIGHHLKQEDAVTRMAQLLDYWGSRFGVRNEWSGNRAFIEGQIMGIDFRARLDVGDRTVGGEFNDPGVLLRGSAEDYIRKKVQKYLHPQYREP